MTTEVETTEFLEIIPEELHLVPKGANGFKALLAKAAETEVELVKADTSDAPRPKCDTCDGKKAIRNGHVRCPDCHGTGLKPRVGETVKELFAAAKKAGVAPSGAPGSNDGSDCDTCNGSGKVDDDLCPDCDGAKFSESDVKAGFDGSISDGDPQGREKIDKAADDSDDKDDEGNGGCGCCDKCDDDCDGSCCKDCDMGDDDGDAEKATVSTADQNDLPDSDFAFIEDGGKKDADGKTTPRSLRHFPIMDAAHVRNALARAPQSPFGDKAMPKIKAAAKKFGIEVSDDASKAAGYEPKPYHADADETVECPKCDKMNDTDASYCDQCGFELKGASGVKVGAEKSVDTVEKDGTISGANPFLNGTVLQSDGDDDAPDGAPGSPEWEAVDAQTATAAATALMEAAELIRTFAQREAQEVVAGEGNDVFDTSAAYSALCNVSDALGVMAQMAFHEGLAAQKSEGNDVEKAGRRLSTKTVAALAAARDKSKELSDHLTGVLGDDDPAHKNKTDDTKATKGAVDYEALYKEIDSMSHDELTKLLDERDEKLVERLTEAVKGKSTDGDADNGSDAKDAQNENDAADGTDADASDAGDAEKGVNDAADNEDNKDGEDGDAAKSDDTELTDEQIEAKRARKEAKKALKDAREAENIAAENAAVAKAIEEATATAREAISNLEERLATVEKMAAPSTVVRTRTQDAASKASERDAIQTEIDRNEQLARTTTEPELRKGYLERVAELRKSL